MSDKDYKNPPPNSSKNSQSWKISCIIFVIVHQFCWRNQWKRGFRPFRNNTKPPPPADIIGPSLSQYKVQIIQRGHIFVFPNFTDKYTFRKVGLLLPHVEHSSKVIADIPKIIISSQLNSTTWQCDLIAWLNRTTCQCDLTVMEWNLPKDIVYIVCNVFEFTWYLCWF